MPLFSIVIPVYNSERYLIECVQSVLKQNFKNREIILVDDCSTDKSSEICDSFAKQNESIKVIHHEKNRGVSASRNNGINAASGEYISFLDSDDCLIDGCLNGVAKLIEGKSGPDLIIGRYISQRYSQRGEDSLSQDFATFDNNAINIDNPDGAIAHINDFSLFEAVCWRYFIARNFIIENELYFIQVKVYEDLEYVIRLLCLAKKFAFYDGYLYRCRQRPQSLTYLINHSKDYTLSASFLEVANEMCKFIKNNNLSDLKKELLYTAIKNCFKTFYIYLFIYGRKEIYEFSKIIEANIDNFKILENTPDDIDIYFFIRTYGAYYGLLLYRAFITEKTISLIKDSRDKKLYIFCADLHGKATAQVLRNEGYRVKGFLDNNEGLKGSVFLGLNVYHPSVLSYESKGKLSDIFVIVCHKQRGVFEKISNQLEGIGLKKEQITHKIF